MNTIGIIAEYNPFHKGHAHQLEELRQKYPNATLLVVMSGDFVQRGTPAIFSKFDRAQWAVMDGADIVFELPSMFAVSSAEYFAAGGVRLLHSLGCDAISFGVGYPSADALISLAKDLDRPETQAELRKNLKKGDSYGTALRNALRPVINNFLSDSDSIPPYNKEQEQKNFSIAFDKAVVLNNERLLDTDPNALLGIEYIRAMHRYHIELKVLPIERTSLHHNYYLDQEYPSGSALRKAIYEWIQYKENIKFLHDYKYFLEARGREFILFDFYIRERTFPCKWDKHLDERIVPFVHELVNTHQCSNLDRYYDMVHFQSRVLPKDELSALQDMSEGLEDAWLKANVLPSWDQVRESLKSKRYTYARLDRIATYSLFRRTKEIFQKCHQQGPTYGRLLAFNDRGRQYLKEKRASIPIVQKWAPFCQSATGTTKVLCEQDQLASKLWRMTVDNPNYRGSHYDFTTSPIYV